MIGNNITLISEVVHVMFMDGSAITTDVAHDAQTAGSERSCAYLQRERSHFVAHTGHWLEPHRVSTRHAPACYSSQRSLEPLRRIALIPLKFECKCRRRCYRLASPHKSECGCLVCPDGCAVGRGYRRKLTADLRRPVPAPSPPRFLIGARPPSKRTLPRAAAFRWLPVRCEFRPDHVAYW